MNSNKAIQQLTLLHFFTANWANNKTHINKKRARVIGFEVTFDSNSLTK